MTVGGKGIETAVAAATKRTAHCRISPCDPLTGPVAELVRSALIELVRVLDLFIVGDVQGAYESSAPGIRPTVVTVHEIADDRVGGVEVSGTAMEGDLGTNYRERQRDSGASGEPAGPGSGAQHDGPGLNAALAGCDRADTALVYLDFGDFHPFVDARAVAAGGGRVAMEDERWINVSGLRFPGADLILFKGRARSDVSQHAAGSKVGVCSCLTHERDVAGGRIAVPRGDDEQAADVV